MKTKTGLYNMAQIAVLVISTAFMLNTIGNILAEELFERILFTPLTFFSSLLAFRIGVE